MPTRDPARAIDVDDVARLCAEQTVGRPGETGLGIEVEAFVLATSPIRRISIAGPDGLLSALSRRRAGHAAWAPVERDAELDATGWRMAMPGLPRLSFEPGGQVEISTSYSPHPSTAVTSAMTSLAGLASAVAEQGWWLVPVGTDRWAAGTVAQQLTGPRYPAMDASLATRGPAGRTMMRDTCALQLNLDLDVGTEARDRWLVTNLLAPVAVAAFACSPDVRGRRRVRSVRARAWQQLDPTRTGCVLPSADSTLSPAEQWRRFALAADVLLIVDGDESHPIGPGWRFGDWVRDGHPRYGWPTEDDLRHHLTTLFPEVRPRRWLEVRSPDAVPAQWRAAVVALYLGAVYDRQARDRILGVLSHRPTPLAEQLRTAAEQGVADASWCATAVEVWSFALEGAWRLSPHLIDARSCRQAEALLDRYTVRGRCPGDELTRRYTDDGPEAALRWAAEPTTADEPVPQEACP